MENNYYVFKSEEERDVTKVDNKKQIIGETALSAFYLIAISMLIHNYRHGIKSRFFLFNLFSNVFGLSYHTFVISKLIEDAKRMNEEDSKYGYTREYSEDEVKELVLKKK